MIKCLNSPSSPSKYLFYALSAIPRIHDRPLGTAKRNQVNIYGVLFSELAETRQTYETGIVSVDTAWVEHRSTQKVYYIVGADDQVTDC